MFEPTEVPRVFGVPPGVDFPQALVDGILSATADEPPELLARVQIIVSTTRMSRRLREIFEHGPARLLPKVTLITALNGLVPGVVSPPAISALRRRLELIALVSALLDRNPDLAPRTSLYDLADSLATLIDEMQGEGVSPDAISDLDVSDQSGHWDRAKTFLGIAQTYLEQTEAEPDKEALRRSIVTDIGLHWHDDPPAGPVILAGSTGSRGTTMLLMQAIAKLPQGALVLPGFDFDTPTGAWAALDNPLMSEDHPQYRFYALLKELDLSPNVVQRWHNAAPPSPERNKLISLSLRPAPVTDAWRIEGPNLIGLTEATKRMTLVEAETPRAEALAIAMKLRVAAEEGRTAALITPDRMLTRRVTSALSRWNILPDDSAGTPLQLSPPGRFLRHVAGLFTHRLDAEALLTLLKHPLSHSNDNRNEHQLFTQRVELAIRARGLPYPDPVGFINLAAKSVPVGTDPAKTLAWAEWIAITLMDRQVKGELPLVQWIEGHLQIANMLAAGPDGTDRHGLWRQNAGEKARAVMADLLEQAPHGGSFSAADYADIVGSLLSGEEVRDRDAPHPGIMIWGTLEARVQGADLVILGGLNDGTWPEAPPPDPWLNRKMRSDAGLLLPERRIGLSAHDYQQAVCAPEVWLTRSIRSEDAETVPSRWLNRLSNLMNGLPRQGGKTAFEDMRSRGQYWLDQARTLERTDPICPSPRPSPRPPVSARPRNLSVTEITRLIRDPYAIYAKHCLKLRMLRPLVQSPDAPLRGVIVHAVLERFVKNVTIDPSQLNKYALLETSLAVLTDLVPWPAVRVMWLAKIERIAYWFIEEEAKRQATAQAVAFENGARGKLELTDLGFTLRCVADRIDRDAAGDVLIYDYKTGTPPAAKKQIAFEKQLLIEAAMIEEGAFAEIGAARVAKAAYIGLGSKPSEVPAPLEEEPPEQVLLGLRDLIASYLSPTQGFTSRRMMEQDRFSGDYDHLARFGEWDDTDEPVPEDLI